jgi:hypothetical protein
MCQLRNVTCVHVDLIIDVTDEGGVADAVSALLSGHDQLHGSDPNTALVDWRYAQDGYGAQLDHEVITIASREEYVEGGAFDGTPIS